MINALSDSRLNTHVIARRRQFRRRLVLELLESRHMLASDWQNPLFNLDVNDDGGVNPLDVLVVINDINTLGSRLLPPRDENGTNFLDCDGDGYVAPIDVLVVVNAINAALPSPSIDIGLLSDNGFSCIDLITIPIPS